jgi:serpin B
MMSCGSGATAYAKGANWQAVELPYAGGTTSMVIVLPDAAAFTTVEQGLTSSFYASVTAALASTANIELTMPSFTIHGGSVSLIPELQALGMTDAFTPSANFTAMMPDGGVPISAVLHQAYVSVDEYGTEATAATAVVFSDAGVEEAGAPVVVELNRPFFFFLRDIKTGTVLFVGREADPTAQ